MSKKDAIKELVLNFLIGLFTIGVCAGVVLLVLILSSQPLTIKYVIVALMIAVMSYATTQVRRQLNLSFCQTLVVYCFFVFVFGIIGKVIGW